MIGPLTRKQIRELWVHEFDRNITNVQKLRTTLREISRGELQVPTSGICSNVPVFFRTTLFVLFQMKLGTRLPVVYPFPNYAKHSAAGTLWEGEQGAQRHSMVLWLLAALDQLIRHYHTRRIRFYHRWALRRKWTHCTRMALLTQLRQLRHEALHTYVSSPTFGICWNIRLRLSGDTTDYQELMTSLIRLWKHPHRDRNNILPCHTVDSRNQHRKWTGNALEMRLDLLDFMINTLELTL